MSDPYTRYVYVALCHSTLYLTGESRTFGNSDNTLSYVLKEDTAWS